MVFADKRPIFMSTLHMVFNHLFSIVSFLSVKALLGAFNKNSTSSGGLFQALRKLVTPHLLS